MLSESIQRVLELQESFSADKTDLMLERNNLVKNTIPTQITSLLHSQLLERGISSNGSGGIGNNAIVPWARIFHPRFSPSAQSGWYVVFLFAGNGDVVHLSLNLGVTKISKREIVPLHDQAKARLLEAGHILESTPGIQTSIELSAPANQLAQLYERGNLAAFSYKKGEVPADEIIMRDLELLLSFLEVVQETSSPIGRTLEINASDELERLRKATFWTPEQIGAVIESLFDDSPQVIFYGPPGTGKTHVAQELARYIVDDGTEEEIGEDRIRIVQFHPSYGYEDFVEGLRPIANHKGQIEFQAVPGVLMDIVKKIEEDGKPRVLIIDEMNRANLPRVFGELMFLLEYRNRSVSLLLRETFALPSNLFIIGTINTADRSIKNIDIALRRRFDFFPLDPDVNILRSYYSEMGTNQLGEMLYEGFQSLNREIISDLAHSGYAVGHSYFMRPQMDEELLRSIWDRQIFPLLGDYFSDRPETLKSYTFDTFWQLA